jgi:regulator of replication initiation timing
LNKMSAENESLRMENKRLKEVSGQQYLSPNEIGTPRIGGEMGSERSVHKIGSSRVLSEDPNVALVVKLEQKSGPEA